jgi:hypothetical protein
MKNAIMFVLGCSVATVMPPRAAAEDTLCIHLYNLARVRPQTLEWATSVASGAFSRAGISTRWEHHLADSSESNLVDLNTSVVELSRSENRSCLVVRLVRDLPPTNYPGALGFAHPLARFGVSAEILYRRVEIEAARVGMEPYILLAYTFAHEIGHVLLRSSRHALAGVMEAHPGAETWRLASMGGIAFLPEEAKQMRREVRHLNTQAHNPITVASNEVAGLND